MIFYVPMNPPKKPQLPDNDILTMKELASYLKIAEKTAYKYALEGKIPGFKVGGNWRFRKQDIDLWISNQMKLGKGSN